MGPARRRRWRHGRDARPGVREGGRERLHRLGASSRPSSRRRSRGRRSRAAVLGQRHLAGGPPAQPHTARPRMNTRHIRTAGPGSAAAPTSTPSIRTSRTPPPSTPGSRPPAMPAIHLVSALQGLGRRVFLHPASERGARRRRHLLRLSGDDIEQAFAFTQSVGEAFLDIYPQLVRRHMDRPWTAEERQHQLVRRRRYVEFNLSTIGARSSGCGPAATRRRS